MATVKRSKEIFDAIRVILLESEGGDKRLNYSMLYDKVNDKLKKQKGKGISNRDFDSVIQASVKEKRLLRTEDPEAKSKVKPVYFSLTQKALKRYQQDFLGFDEVKDKRRKLFQLLLIYEICKGSRVYIRGDNDLDKFLKSVFLSRSDLKISRKSTDSDTHKTFITFHPLNDMEVSKWQKHDYKGIGKIPRCILGTRGRTQYTVGLPGFTIEEIFRYADDQTLFYFNGPWFHPSSIFSDARFSIEEIRDTFGLFEKTHLIKPFSITKDASMQSELLHELQGRYFVADKRLQTLSHLVWKLYQEKLSILESKYMGRSFDERDREWLLYVLGKWATERLIQEWDDRRSVHTFNEEGIEIKAGRWNTESDYDRVREVAFNDKVNELVEKFRPVLEEYDLPLSYIRTLLSIS
jgi:hypothetical protein